jgi:hypothetical protein
MSQYLMTSGMALSDLSSAIGGQFVNRIAHQAACLLVERQIPTIYLFASGAPRNFQLFGLETWLEPNDF